MTLPATCWEDAYRTQVEAVRELRAENAELRATLELVMAADERAVDAWRAAHPGTALVWPDRAALVAWLLEQNDELKRVVDDPHAMQIHYRRAGNGWDVCSTERVQTLHRDNERLEAENAELRAHAERVGQANDRLVVENAALRADRERLDWLTNSLGWIVVGNVNEADPSQHAKEGDTLADAWRAAIDAARKEAQP